MHVTALFPTHEGFAAAGEESWIIIISPSRSYQTAEVLILGESETFFESLVINKQEILKQQPPLGQELPLWSQAAGYCT